MTAKLYVSNLPFALQDEELSNFFSAAGVVLSVKIIHDKETKRSRGFGFVEMQTADQAKLAIEKLNNLLIKGRAISIVEARARENVQSESSSGKKLLME